MRLYLVQHGAAKTEAEDPQRGLTDEGRRTVERMAEFLSSLRLQVDCIEHSEKLRARQTAEILAAHLKPAEGTRQVARIAPNDDVEPMRVRLEKESKNLMLVGHLPHLSRLVARLLGLAADRTLVQFHMGGVVRIDRGGTGIWVIEWALVPELLPPDSSR
jgi:phosphohistidine phosphatase